MGRERLKLGCGVSNRVAPIRKPLSRKRTATQSIAIISKGLSKDDQDVIFLKSIKENLSENRRRSIGPIKSRSMLENIEFNAKGSPVKAKGKTPLQREVSKIPIKLRIEKNDAQGGSFVPKDYRILASGITQVEGGVIAGEVCNTQMRYSVDHDYYVVDKSSRLTARRDARNGRKNIHRQPAQAYLEKNSPERMSAIIRRIGPDYMRIEWLHIIGFLFMGAASQQCNNFLVGTRCSNLIMLVPELAVKYLIDNNFIDYAEIEVQQYRYAGTRADQFIVDELEYAVSYQQNGIAKKITLTLPAFATLEDTTNNIHAVIRAMVKLFFIDDDLFLLHRSSGKVIDDYIDEEVERTELLWNKEQPEEVEDEGLELESCCFPNSDDEGVALFDDVDNSLFAEPEMTFCC